MLTEALIVAAPCLVAAAACGMGYEMGSLDETQKRSLTERERN